MNREPRTTNYQLRTTSYLPAPKGCLRYANRLSSLICQPIMTSFMQNKPNFRKAKTNITSIITKDYEYEPRLRPPRKQTQSNPILPALRSFSVGGLPPADSNLASAYSQGQAQMLEFLMQKNSLADSKYQLSSTLISD